MPGIKIGNVSIISSRSVVTSDVPAYSVIGGNPARVIKNASKMKTFWHWRSWHGGIGL